MNSIKQAIQESRDTDRIHITVTPTEKYYMNTATGSVDTYDGWDYENEDGETVNAVDLDEVVEVEKDADGNWIEV